FCTSRTRSPLALLALALTLGPVLGQGLNDGEVALEKKARETRLLRVALFKGEVHADPANKEHQEAIEGAAKDAIYQLEWKTGGRPKEGEVNYLVANFESSLLQMTKSRNNTQTMQRLFCQQAIDRALEVIQNSKPIAAINAARMLSLIPERRVVGGCPPTEQASAP